MADFVLVHGAWGGAWIWQRVLEPLRQAGHRVHAVTLTGVGDRAHLAKRVQPPIDLSTHVQDVVERVKVEELQGIVLVGHSYGGMVVTGAADRLLAEDAGRVAKMVYVDAIVPEPNEAWNSTQEPKTVADRIAQAKANGGFIPPADPKAFGIEGEDRAWLLRRQAGQPLGTYTEKLDFDAARQATLPHLFIDCVEPALPTIAASRQRARQRGWQVVEMETGHCPQVTMPEVLALTLSSFGGGTAKG